MHFGRTPEQRQSNRLNPATSLGYAGGQPRPSQQDHQSDRSSAPSVQRERPALWSLSCTAFSHDSEMHHYHHFAACCVTVGEAEAVEAGMEAALNAFPPEDGFYDHGVNASRVSAQHFRLILQELGFAR
ncbi:hypothetical protein [Dictyobacter arantiisoli]|uniref:Uncharacterized protein n=1 Tax=Dictyobacter arantiisoli TaxID=2014874 RepID=A0A5A5TH55_9CHLR|nr:hypothetical protein [Dictyobacter arantiisoli]GCF10901.1 hypothetical protein KDI_44650 [Dictyobacter arantiisoli]